MTAPITQDALAEWVSEQVIGGLDDHCERVAAALLPLIAAAEAALEHENHQDGKCGCCWTIRLADELAKIAKVKT